MSISKCCLEGFKWNGTPGGVESKLAGTEVYIAGSPTSASGVLLVSDLFGWTFTNLRLLADHYAREAGVTVYLANFFDEILDLDLLYKEDFQALDLFKPETGFLSRNSREKREPLIFDCARELRKKHEKVGAIGFCYGGWAVFRLGAKEHQPPLVDCISAGHPSLLTKDDIDNVAVPVQILAPEFDPPYTKELKLHTFEVLQKLGVPFDYQHFPGVHHTCLVRGDESKEGEREAMQRGKNAAIAWFQQWLSV